MKKYVFLNGNAWFWSIIPCFFGFVGDFSTAILKWKGLLVVDTGETRQHKPAPWLK
tara:strand:+ start:406 stop:573 length:168 start_codon:yes stop_codon:yes gene_type:complete